MRGSYVYNCLGCFKLRAEVITRLLLQILEDQALLGIMVRRVVALVEVESKT